MSYYVYIMTNKNRNVRNVGVTNDLVYFEQTTDVHAALAREKQIKSWSRMKKFLLVREQNPGLADLYPTIAQY